MNVCHLHRGHRPILVSLPHDGVTIPDDIAERMTNRARTAPDTDWFVSRLYDFAKALGASILVPKYSRYVIDLNRPPDDVSLYPGQNTTGLCPTVQFSGEPVYLDGHEPMRDEIDARIETFWRPYHDALQSELARLRAEHGRVLLWEGHSIHSQVPFLFDGRLPDFNLGTVGGRSCSGNTEKLITDILSAQSEFSWVVNGRFKGGYITRRYGDPANNIDAVQLEISQCIYMNEDSYVYDDGRATNVQAIIRGLIETAAS